MRDGLLFGLALFFIIGSVVFAQAAGTTYFVKCGQDVDYATKDVYCDPTVIYETIGLFAFFGFIGVSFAYTWYLGRPVPVAGALGA